MLNAEQDSCPRQNTSEKKRIAILETYEQPVYPKLSRILFISMLALTAAMAAVEIRNGFFVTGAAVSRFVSNLSTTCLTLWLLYAILLVPTCLLGMRRNRHDYESRKQASGIVDQTDHERQRSRRAVQRLNHSYLLYLAVTLGGLLIWSLFYLAVYILL